MKNILLTFDVEEFDLPREYDQDIGEDEMYGISKQGLNSIIQLLDKHNIKATFFTTANFAKKYPQLIGEMHKKGHEIACHGYNHSDDYLENLSNLGKAKQEIEKIIKSEIKGFRAPRFEISTKNIAKLEELGFSYDSSIYPTIAPGKYCNIHKKRKIHKIGEIIEIPLSTLPLFPFLRAPINWYMFKHFPKSYRQMFAKINFIFSGYLMLIFHPWEFEDLNQYNLPKTFKKKHGKEMLDLLDNYLLFCKKNRYSFDTISNYLQKSLR